MASVKHSLTGFITNQDGKPVAKQMVFAFNRDNNNKIIGLGKSLTDTEGRYIINFLIESRDNVFVKPNVFIRVMDGEKILGESDIVKEAPIKIKLDLTINIRVGNHDPNPNPNPEPSNRLIKGRVFYSNRLEAKGIKLKLYKIKFGDPESIGTTTTDVEGFYKFEFINKDEKFAFYISRELEAGKEVQLINTRYSSNEQEEINLVVPVDSNNVDSEYARLIASVQKFLDGKNLGDAKENEEKQELSYIFQNTGWDSRLIGLAAIADKLSASTKVGAEVLYGLFRTGMPTGTEQLARVSNEGIIKSLTKANNEGIIKVDVAAAAKSVSDFSTEIRRSKKLPGGIATLDTFMGTLKANDEEKKAMAALHLQHDLKGEALWKKAKELGVADKTIKQAKVQGKLSFLTLNNQQLSEKLEKDMNDAEDLSVLAEKGYYKPDTWKKAINILAENDDEKLKNIIPDLFKGEKTEDRLDSYANDLSRKIKTAYPTHSLISMISNDDMKLGKNHSIEKADVTKMLSNAMKIDMGDGKTYTPGGVSMNAFIKENKEAIVQGIDAKNVDQAIQSFKRISALYQISPSDDAMQVLYNLGFSSALEIASISYDDWMNYFGPSFSTKEQAQLSYTKSEQVHTMVYNFYTAAAKVDSELNTPSDSSTPAETVTVKENLLKQFPSLETLFGSMDFCECDHCRSILGPAAYLVDILKFLDPNESDWNNIKMIWSKKHNDAVYNGSKPYEELILRRADIPQIQLNCENTNIAMPYIDIVNEILECFVAGKDMKTAAFDTGENTSQDLIAQPQNILSEAYNILNAAKYPINAPFDYSLEMGRRICEYYEIPFWKLLNTFRKSDDLNSGGVVAPYYMNDIFVEYLGLGSAEYELYTNLDFGKWFELYGYNDEATAITPAINANTKQRIDILSAKTLSRKLNITYKELSQLVQTSFINPSLDELRILRTLKISAEDVFRWKSAGTFTPFTAAEITEFESQLTAKSFDGFDAKQWLTDFWNTNKFTKIILLKDTNAAADFDETTVQFADASKLTSLEWVKINLFVRLWKKLGWKMEELDQALTGLLPSDSAISVATLGSKFKTALVYLSHIKFLNETYSLGNNSLLKWTTIWNFQAKRSNKIYESDFLTPSVIKDDEIFTHPLGKYLSIENGGVFTPFTFNPVKADDKATGNVGLINHLSPIQAVYQMTSDEIKNILNRNNIDFGTTPLTIENLSKLYGYRILREVTKLSINELFTLQDLSGLDPLKVLSTTPLTDINNDIIFKHTIPFLEIVQIVKSIGLSVADFDFIVRHRFDKTSSVGINENDALGFVRKLSQEMKRIYLEQAPPADINVITDEFVNERLVLALSPDVATMYTGMWNDTQVFTAKRPVVPGKKLPDTLLGSNKKFAFRYNDTNEIQVLNYTGVIDVDAKIKYNAQLTALANTPASNPEHITTSQKQLALELIDDIQLQAVTFYNQHIFKPMLNEDVNLDFTNFYPVINPAHSEQEQLNKKNTKRSEVAKGILRYLKSKFSGLAVLSQLAETFEMDASLLRYFLNDKSVFSLNGENLNKTYMMVSEQGVTIRFIKNEVTGELSGPELTKTTILIKPEEIPVDTKLILIEGYLESQVSEAFRFHVTGSKENVKIKFLFSHLNTAFIEKTLTAGNLEVSEVIPLEAGTSYKYRLEFRDSNDNTLSVKFQSESTPLGEINRLSLVPINIIDSVIKANTVFKKISKLITQYSLQEKEIRYFTSKPDHLFQLSFINLPLTELKVSDAAQKSVIEKLFSQLIRIKKYTDLRSEVAGGKADLVDLMESILNDDATTRNTLITNISLLTKRSPESVEALMNNFGFLPGSVAKINAMERMWECMKVLFQFKAEIKTIDDFTGIISKTLTYQDKFENAKSFRLILQSHYSKNEWNKVAQSIFDKIRPLQRDALCAFIMHKMDFKNMGQLFEYFLLDPGMEPVVQISRIRLATSSVQTFIQRCLLNLEEKVSPTLINRKQWEWMKRYRVWEANRKIFLFPENWLEPEFRDDKTHLFLELEGAIMQGDINREMVERAFYNYLRGLEKISRLNMIAMYCEQFDDLQYNTIHVIGKSYTSPSYYYRSYQGTWKNWIPIPDQIEGEHLALIKWYDRLHIFWLTFLPKSESAHDPAKSATDASLVATGSLISQKIEIQLNWCEYYQGEWKPRETGGFENALITPVTGRFNLSDVYVHVSMEKDPDTGDERAVLIHVSGGGIESKAFRLVSKLTNPVHGATYYSAPAKPAFDGFTKRKTKYFGSGEFKVSFVDVKTITDTVNDNVAAPTETLEPLVSHSLLKLNLTEPTSFLFCNDVIKVSDDNSINELISPFFLEDNEKSITLYVEPEMEEKTINTYEEWVMKETTVTRHYEDDKYWKDVPIKAFVPYNKYYEFDQLVNVAAATNFPKEIVQLIQTSQDWVVNPSTIISYENGFLGSNGGLTLMQTGNADLIRDMVGSKEAISVNVNSNGNNGSTNVLVSEPTSGRGNSFGVPGIIKSNVIDIHIVGNNGINLSSMPGLRMKNFNMLPSK